MHKIKFIKKKDNNSGRCEFHKAVCNKQIDMISYIAAGMKFEINGAVISILSPIMVP